MASKSTTFRVLLLVVPVVALVLYFVLRKPATDAAHEDVIIKVTEGPMVVTIHAPGELQARKSQKINGPNALRTVGIYQLNIENLVPEGTVVQEGQFVASLDRTDWNGKRGPGSQISTWDPVTTSCLTKPDLDLL